MSGAVVSLDEKVTEDQPLTDGGLNKVWSLDDSLGARGSTSSRRYESGYGWEVDRGRGASERMTVGAVCQSCVCKRVNNGCHPLYGSGPDDVCSSKEGMEE